MTSDVQLYGIRNCDTVKKARTWLEAQGVAYVFHDYKSEGVDPQRLQRWCVQSGWEALLNRSGTTWRKLPEADRLGVDEARATALMSAHSSLIRRPVAEVGDRIEIGFDPAAYARLLAI
jgi:arsenate reductase